MRSGTLAGGNRRQVEGVDSQGTLPGAEAPRRAETIASGRDAEGTDRTATRIGIGWSGSAEGFRDESSPRGILLNGIRETAREPGARDASVSAQKLRFLEAASSSRSVRTDAFCVKIPLRREKGSHGCGNLEQVAAVKPSYKIKSHSSEGCAAVEPQTHLELISRRLRLGRFGKCIRHRFKGVADHRLTLVEMGAKSDQIHSWLFERGFRELFERTPLPNFFRRRHLVTFVKGSKTT